MLALALYSIVHKVKNTRGRKLSFKHCPGIKNLIGPVKIIFRTCPSCGEEVEFFSDEVEAKCDNCGRKLHRGATPSCVTWCKYAKKCIKDLENRGKLSPSNVSELLRIAKKENTKE